MIHFKIVKNDSETNGKKYEYYQSIYRIFFKELYF